MSKYLVRIEQRNTYINIRPIVELRDNGWGEVDDSIFGNHGTMQIGAIYNDSDSPLLQPQGYSIFDIADTFLFSLEITPSGSRKIKQQDFLTRAKSVDTSYARELIHLPSTMRIVDFLHWKKEGIQNAMMPLTKSIYLDDGEFIAGPFSWVEVSDGNYHFKPNALGDDPNMVPCFKINDIETIYSFEAGKGNDFFAGQNRSVLNMNALPHPQTMIDCIDNKGLKDILYNRLSSSSETRKSQRELREMINELPEDHFTETRRKRILDLVKNSEFADQIIEQIPGILLGQDDAKREIVEAIVSNKNFLDRIYPVLIENEDFQSLSDQLNKELEQKTFQLKALEDNLNALKESVPAVTDNDSKEVIELRKENKQLMQKLSEYSEIEDAKEVYKEYSSKSKDAERDYQTFRDRAKEYKEQFENVKQDISGKIQGAYLDIAIDGVLSNLMMKEAIKFEKQQQKSQMANLVADVSNIPERSGIDDTNELISFLYDELTNKAHRALSKNDIANLLLCISQGFLTVLAGEPGSGKTSLVGLLAALLGLNNAQSPRYVEIPVEKGWTSRRDLIGYYNPLTKFLEATHKDLLVALLALNEEAKQNICDLPYWVLLDEANLSQMEYYWADFMSLCDLDKRPRKISLSEEYEFYIPQTLRFLATINLDHTTEILSPRLIDRAWIIMVQPSDTNIEYHEDSIVNSTYPMIANSIFHGLSNPITWKSRKLENAIITKYQEVQACFKSIGVSFSPRIIGMIKRYCLASVGVIDTSENTYAALDYAIAQKILPTINGYGEVFVKFLTDLEKVCDKNTMPLSHKLLLSIQQKGKTNMQYYQFFAR